MTIRHIVYIYILAAISLSASAQSDDWDDFANEYMGEILDEEEDNGREIYEELLEMHRQPININKATRDDLLRMPFLSDAQADSVLSLVSRSHGLLSMGELMFVRNLEYKQRRYLALFFFCPDDQSYYDRGFPPDSAAHRGSHTSPKQEGRGLRTQLSSTFGFPLYKREGFRSHPRKELEQYPNRQYLGNSLATTLRYRSSLNGSLSWGLTAQKDEGEPFAEGKNWLYDSYSLFLMGKSKGAVRKWIVGDFTAHFGLGLTMGSSGCDPMNVVSSMRPRQEGLTAHTATDEALFLRGGALALSLSKISVTAFASWRKLDATLSSDSISTIITNGYHRTPLEMSKRNNIAALQGGLAAGIPLGALRLGVNAVHTHYDTPFRSPTTLYRKHYFTGSDFGNYSLSYSLRRGAISAWGETATSEQGGIAMLHRVQYAPHHKLILNVLHRYYSTHYLATSAQSYKIGSRIQNEHGLMLGITAQPCKPLLIKAYADIAHFPFAVYASANPKNALTAMLQAEYSPFTTSSWLLRYKLRTRPDDNSLKAPDQRVQHSFKAQYRYADDRIVLTSTADLSLLSLPDKGSSSGWMISQKASLKMAKHTGVSMSAALFHTDSYAEALRLYEPILLYSSGYPVLYYHGLRFAASVQHRIGPLHLAVKYALTHYTDRDTIGTGLRQYNGSTLQDILIQVALRL